MKLEKCLTELCHKKINLWISIKRTLKELMRNFNRPTVQQLIFRGRTHFRIGSRGKGGGVGLEEDYIYSTTYIIWANSKLFKTVFGK
jgi:hypothetical protein